jgi:anti-anti-sigma factor
MASDGGAKGEQSGRINPSASRAELYRTIHGRKPMSITFEDTQGTLRRIRLTGRLDILGIEAISATFAELAKFTSRSIVVDLSGVDFLVSFGLRELITNAKAVQQRGGRMVIFVGSNTAVHKTLETTGIDTLIPTFADAAQADRAAAA